MQQADQHEILELIGELLGENGCGWDKEQTPGSLCDYLLEETYELVEAVRSKDRAGVREELGDVFFLLFFLAVLLHQEQGLELSRVWQENVRKMKRRHPHVFAEASIDTRQELQQQWEAIKKQEKRANNQEPKPEDLFDAVPGALPPLQKAYRLNSKAAGDGFTWKTDADHHQALIREWQEWQRAVADGDPKAKEEEFGDLLFNLVEQGRRQGIKASGALARANLKFVRRFRAMCALAAQKGLDWDGLDLEDKDRLWEEVKKADG
ncbi:MAG: nucleoside triphosphate pyrophosphohydrolase [Desulfohalobiaceae bacterium]|nr:nucleoside triphosphate pyrophosphohydrolase [Desulfohalobiaceae bacterium]